MTEQKRLTYKDFLPFYNQPFIKSIMNKKRWTISDNKKRPIDINWWKTTKEIRGAKTTDATCLTTLTELCQLIPDAANHAFFMDAIIDKFIVLDIEPSCPDDIKQELLKLPYLYGETSLSGKGVHLVFNLPTNFSDFPIAKKKVKLQEEHKYYEILLNHWCTFTRNMIPKSTEKTALTIEDVFENLAKNAKDSIQSAPIDATKNFDATTIPNFSIIMYALSQSRYNKTPNDFHGDMSKYEFGCAGFYHYKLVNILKVDKIKDIHPNYTPNERTWLLYTFINELLPYRAKHDEIRNGLPWLLYISKEIVARNL